MQYSMNYLVAPWEIVVRRLLMPWGVACQLLTFWLAEIESEEDWISCEPTNALWPILQRVYELLIEILWKNLFAEILIQWSNLVTILYMQWQLSCHGMCKIVTWLDHALSCMRKIYFLQNLDYELMHSLCNQPKSHKTIPLWEDKPASIKENTSFPAYPPANHL